MAATAIEAKVCHVTPEQLVPCLENLSSFLERYSHHFIRREQREHAVTYVEGLLSDLPRKTLEPIAMAHDEERRPLQRFVGAGVFDDDGLIAELQRHVAEEIGDPAGVLIIDPTCFEKKGTESVGVQRQWNGRLGKQDNCQKGVLLGYASPHGFTLVDGRLYLPESWASDPECRAKCHVPADVEFKTSWQIGLDLIDRTTLPHAWIVADDEYGRPSEFRAELRERGKCYVLDVPSNTLVRPIQASSPAKRRRGRPPTRTVLRASDWARARKSGAWVRVLVRDGTKGPSYVLATAAVVETRLGNSWVRERLVVIKTIELEPRVWYALTNAGSNVSIGAVVCAHATRHVVERAIEQAKGEAGLAHYEVRSWIGWHHHVTFSLLACWFLNLERRRFRQEDADHDRAADCSCDRPSLARSPSEPASPRARDLPAACSDRGGSRPPMAGRGTTTPASIGGPNTVSQAL